MQVNINASHVGVPIGEWPDCMQSNPQSPARPWEQHSMKTEEIKKKVQPVCTTIIYILYNMYVQKEASPKSKRVAAQGGGARNEWTNERTEKKITQLLVQSINLGRFSSHSNWLPSRLTHSDRRLDVCAARCCSAQVSVRPCKGCSLAVPDFAFCYLCVLFSFAPTRELITLMEAIE